MLKYTVRIVDSLGVFTMREYESLKEAVDACRFYGCTLADELKTVIKLAQVVDSNGRICYDYFSDSYDWEDFGMNEEVVA